MSRVEAACAESLSSPAPANPATFRGVAHADSLVDTPNQGKAKPPRCRSYARVSGVIVMITLVAPTGVDPVTSRFSVVRSTN